jgi:AraC-like DNA-binding protein
MKTVISGENMLLRNDLLHFIPAVLFILSITAILLTYNDLLKMPLVPLLSLSIFCSAGYFVATVIFLARQIPGKINGDNIDNKIMIRMALNILFAVCFLVAGIGQMNNRHIYHLSIASNIVFVLASYIISLRYPLKIDYYKNIKNRLFFAYFLPRTDPETLKREMTSKLLSDDLYKDEVTLASLAMSLHIRPHQLSHFINNYLNMSFSDLINSYRVEEAKKEILSKPEATILAIAYESGFNSKASFNRAFKKFTGLTPSEFRDHHK